MLKLLNQAALELGRFEYPPALPIQAPRVWLQLNRYQRYRYPPHRLYHWALLALTTKKSRLRLKHQNEGIFLGETFDRWYDQNQDWIVKQWG